MSEFKRQVVEKILEFLPDAEAQAIEAADHLVDTLELTDISDLPLVTEPDLSSFFGVFKTRRLIQHWQKKTSAENTRAGSARSLNMNQRELNEDYDFKIDWQDLYKSSETVEQRLKSGKKLKSRQKKQFVSRIVNQVRTRVPHAKRAIFRQIMDSMKKKYALSFRGELAKGKLNKNSLCHKMQTKYDNDRRPTRRTRVERMAPAIKAAYGCVKWRLTSFPEGESEDTLQEAQQNLAHYFEVTRPSAMDVEFVDTLMEKTYKLQRDDINKQAEQLIEMDKRLKKQQRLKKKKQVSNRVPNQVPEEEMEEDADDIIDLLTTEQIRDRWPFLFTPRYMMKHFNTLTEIDLSVAILTFMRTSAPLILQFMLDTNDKSGKPKKIKKKMKRAEAQLPPYCAMSIALVKLLMQRFKEKEEAIWMLVDASAKEEDIPVLCKIPKTPRIIIAGEDIFNPTSIFFTMDKQVLGIAENPLDGIALLFSSYFVFNLEYDKEAQVTLEFIQRVIVDMNPATGHKRPKKSDVGHSSNYRVHSYIERFTTKFDEYRAEQDTSSSEVEDDN